MPLRILWSSNAFWAATGYGVQAKSLLPRLMALGHDCAQFAWYGIQGGIVKFNDITVYPSFADPYGRDVIHEHIIHHRADLVITLMDVWVLPPNFVEQCRPARWAPWFPVDMDPIPPQVAAVAKTADYPLTYSRFGHEQALRAGIQNAGYIPHGIEIGIFKPGDRQAARQKIGVPEDAYVMSMVAANKGMPPRKAFPEIFTAFARFRARHPEAMLYLHTLQGTQHGGCDLTALLAACDIPNEAVRISNQYQYAFGMPPDYVAAIYQASDVLLSPSCNEGFGIPIIEAQACGCPVITTNFTSMPELTINGIATEPAQRAWQALNSWAAVPSVSNIHEAMEAIYSRTPDERAMWADDGSRAMHEAYDWDVLVRDWWQPFLQRVEADIRSAPVPLAVPAPEVINAD